MYVYLLLIEFYYTNTDLWPQIRWNSLHLHVKACQKYSRHFFFRHKGPYSGTRVINSKRNHNRHITPSSSYSNSRRADLYSKQNNEIISLRYIHETASNSGRSRWHKTPAVFKLVKLVHIRAHIFKAYP